MGELTFWHGILFGMVINNILISIFEKMGWKK